jgi:hypothetical protein
MDEITTISPAIAKPYVVRGTANKTNLKTKVMIQANELRIGNYIMDRGCKVWQIEFWESRTKVSAKSPLLHTHPSFGEMHGHPLTEEIEYLQPIQLTPKILEKCGFKMHKDKGLWRKENFYLHFYTLSENEYCFSYNNYKSASILYLHQLQNLYYALTGVELEVTL